MHIPQPFLPLRVKTENYSHTVSVAERTYTIGADGMLTSICSQGHELLAGPMRLVMAEDGSPSQWDLDYPQNESESFIVERDDDHTVICGTMQSERFIVNLCYTIEFDGNIDIALKLMTRGHTVAQGLGLAATKPLEYRLDKLWVELPLNPELFTLMHSYPASDITLSDGTVLPKSRLSAGRRIPEQSVSMPFKALMWLGNEDRGLGWFAESHKNWQPNDPNRAMELVHREDQLILRIRLLDCHPAAWNADPANGVWQFYPVDFQFGFQATPVKKFPQQPYLHNAFHLDCGFKIKGNYRDFLSENNRFDLLKERGVTTLILHEKWNKMQNNPKLSEFTRDQIQYIVDECHKRDIKVLVYFGYEISTLAPFWSEMNREVMVRKSPEQEPGGGWWRVPFQRAYMVCYETQYADFLVDGIINVMDTCHIDGVYLDGTATPRACYSLEHGCGWYDHTGELCCTYALKAIRHLFQKLYTEVSARGKHINVHTSGCLNFMALPYIHQSWYGEDIQTHLMHNNNADIDLDYFRASYLGRNIGVPVEFLAYENRPIWTFEHALSCALLHGILPRPNNIDYPLELMSKVWKIFGAFPIEKSQWMPYWSNQASASHEKVKISYYRYITLTGQVQLLAFVANISNAPIEHVTIAVKEPVTRSTDMMTKEEVGFTFSLEGFGNRILYLS